MRKSAWNKEDFIKAVASSTTIAGVLRILGKSPNSYGFYRVVHRDVAKYNLSTTHWTGQAHLKGTVRDIKKIPLIELLVERCYTSRKYIKARLIKANLLTYQCAICNLTEWNNSPISLHLDHINGVNHDYRLINLRFLCPNCHSQTNTYCGRNIKSGTSRGRTEDQ